MDMRPDGASVTVLRSGDTFPNFHTSITLVQSGGRTLLIDPGHFADERYLWQGLQRAGVTPGQVDLVINTHSHLDHCANGRHFPRHKLLFHRREVEELERLLVLMQTPGVLTDALANQYAMTRRQAQACAQLVLNARDVLTGFLSVRQGADAMVLLEDETEVAPGVRVVLTPGHTSGHISVLVEGTLQGRVLVAGDAITAPVDLMTERIPFLTSDPAGFLATRRRLLQMPWDVVVCGHGPPVPARVATRKE